MKTHDLRIKTINPLIPPAILREDLPLSEEGSNFVIESRKTVKNILDKKDDRLMVVIGPCSIHDPIAAVDYATRLKKLAGSVADELFIVMRVYFEKPRTTIGWKGLINDPYLDNSYAVNKGLHIGRKLLIDITDIGLPAGCEFLDPITPQFFADMVSWGAIGARTTESQVHRNLTSGLSMPVGFKNGTGGSIQMAIDAIIAATYPHSFLSVTDQGIAAIVTTNGNNDTHIILRGGESGPNYDAENVQRTLAALKEAKLPTRLMIDTSHGNSSKDYKRQPIVVKDIASQMADGNEGITGVLIESFIEDGKQNFGPKETLIYGKSVTDACIGWDMTVPVVHELAKAVKARRSKKKTSQ
jgi:3-deoxy-7-phosphoheptulonate synthase